MDLTILYGLVVALAIISVVSGLLMCALALIRTQAQRIDRLDEERSALLQSNSMLSSEESEARRCLADKDAWVASLERERLSLRGENRALEAVCCMQQELLLRAGG